MITTQLEKMRKSEGGLLSFNNFLSTSTDPNVSLSFADSLISTTLFVSLDHLSHFSHSEKEVLFSMYTVFRIGRMKEIDQRLWKVNLTLTNDNDEYLKRLTDYRRQEINEGTGWVQLGSLMHWMGELNMAKGIYKAILEAVTQNTPLDHEKIHTQLVTMDNDTTPSTFEDVRDLIQINGHLNNSNLAALYNNVGFFHISLGEYSQAMSYLEKALQIWQVSLPPHHSHLATLHNNIGMVQQSMGEHSAALS
jgi:tetratricopeptide (TPR) repeat protein